MRRFLTAAGYLSATGVQADSLTPARSVVVDWCSWMREQRGLTEKTIAARCRYAAGLLDVLTAADGSMQWWAALARGLLDRLDIARTDVLGLSFGGLVAEQLAYDAPTRVRGLVLASTSCGLGGVPSNPASWWNAMLSGDWRPSGGQGPQRLARRWSRVIQRELGAGWATGPRLDGLAEQIAAASLWSSLGWLPRLTQETLVSTGNADALVPAANASILACRMPSPDSPCPRARAPVLVGSGGGGGPRGLRSVASACERRGPDVFRFYRAAIRAAPALVFVSVPDGLPLLPSQRLQENPALSCRHRSRGHLAVAPDPQQKAHT